LKNKRKLIKTLNDRKYLLKLLKSKTRFLKKRICKFIKKRKRLQFQFLSFFPSFLEVNYKTLSILILKDIEIKKSFKFFLNLLSVSNYYFHN